MGGKWCLFMVVLGAEIAELWRLESSAHTELRTIKGKGKIRAQSLFHPKYVDQSDSM